MTVSGTDTRTAILAAAKTALLDTGYASLSTRRIAEEADVPLSQLHYHFGSRQNLVLALLADENERLLHRQTDMYSEETPLWKQWERACDYLDEDLASGYVRVLLEMAAAGYANEEIAAAVRTNLSGWYDLLTDVARRAEAKLGSIGPFTPREIGVLAGLPFVGAEVMLLVGMDEAKVPARSALRKVGEILRSVEETADRGDRR